MKRKNMHYQKKMKKEHGDDGVSPVVGIMLMLVVTIIIAAVVSGFAGGMVGGSNNQQTPTLSMDVKIVNTGEAASSGFYATVLGISTPTPTKNLEIATSWSTTLKDATYGSAGNSTFGGNTTIGSNATAPWGFGSGVASQSMASYTADQRFGNYTLTQGTGLIAEPDSSYTEYSVGSTYSDLQTVLGSKWEELRAGDTVTVRVLYVPTGKIMYQKDIIVTGA
jgi:archaeal type IV pilus assembly protein PilA